MTQPSQDYINKFSVVPPKGRPTIRVRNTVTGQTALGIVRNAQQICIQMDDLRSQQSHGWYLYDPAFWEEVKPISVPE